MTVIRGARRQGCPSVLPSSAAGPELCSLVTKADCLAPQVLHHLAQPGCPPVILWVHSPCPVVWAGLAPLGLHHMALCLRGFSSCSFSVPTQMPPSFPPSQVSLTLRFLPSLNLPCCIDHTDCIYLAEKTEMLICYYAFWSPLAQGQEARLPDPMPIKAQWPARRASCPHLCCRLCSQKHTY